ncbi:hypothetical protein [Chryseobacterium sp. 6424]|uniref:hypothetical protein n=1 Tax=Chryseobacterium sp. 6424 TaxID=2039166 RepID=UPI0013CEB5B0|nr:hypothetical protein [Chryseobacterium sp. 6424]
MKTLSLQQMESINGESGFSSFCAGFAAGQVGVAVAVKIGLIAAPPVGATVGAVVLAIDAACALEWFF